MIKQAKNLKVGDVFVLTLSGGAHTLAEVVRAPTLTPSGIFVTYTDKANKLTGGGFAFSVDEPVVVIDTFMKKEKPEEKKPDDVGTPKGNKIWSGNEMKERIYILEQKVSSHNSELNCVSDDINNLYEEIKQARKDMSSDLAVIAQALGRAISEIRGFIQTTRTLQLDRVKRDLDLLDEKLSAHLDDDYGPVKPGDTFGL